MPKWLLRTLLRCRTRGQTSIVPFHKIVYHSIVIVLANAIAIYCSCSPPISAVVGPAATFRVDMIDAVLV